MPEIAALPASPIAPASNAAAPAANTKDIHGAAASAPNGTENPQGNDAAHFAALLQRLTKGSSSALQEQLLPASDNVPAAANDANLVAALQAQMLGMQGSQGQDKTEKPEEGKRARKDSPADEEPNTALAGLLALAGQNNAAKPVDVSRQEGQQMDGDGKADLSLAAKPANLARPEIADEQVSQHGKVGSDDFQALLESARNLQAGTQNQATATNAIQGHAVGRTETRIDTPVGHQQWSQEVGDKLVWLAGKQESRADLVLNPPQMGRIEVSITMSGDQASASFNSSNQAVREALENALPRLREILADAGVRLDQAQVGSDARGDSPQQQERRDNSGHNNHVVSGETIPGLTPTTSSASQWIKQGNGMVDTFA